MRIDGNAKTVRELLANTKYTLDYYQREYSWQTRHVIELVEDLTKKFLDDYEPDHTPAEVPRYGHYFLGPVIINHTDGQPSIVDGQQRFMTLTLLLIHLRHLLGDKWRAQVDPLIYSMSYGEEGFNLNVRKWHPILNALYSGNSPDASQEPASIRNIAERYHDIEAHFELPTNAVPCFVEWLLKNVYLVEVAASADRDAYEIFETMNDRGLSLTPSDMFRGHLLSHITDPGSRDSARQVWDDRLHSLQNLGRGEESNAIKAWLRSQYAESVRDFDLIGSEFHRWVRDRENDLDLTSSEGFVTFIEREFLFYSGWYLRLKEATKSFKPELECVYYNAQHNFTLQFPVLLAPLRVEDSEEESIRKIQVVSRYLDIFIHRRVWNLLSITQNTMVETMFSVMHDIRGKNASELSELLSSRLNADASVGFASSNRFGLMGGNRPRVLLVLARMTDYVESQSSNQPSRFHEYVRRGRNSYEIEHIWANHFEDHLEEFTHEVEFEDYRNRIGGLLLLRRSDNAAFGDLPFTEKRELYLRENLLASSLHERTYERNPGFQGFINKSGLPFRPHDVFMKGDLIARQQLYRYLAERIWNPERLTLLSGHEPKPIVIHDSEDEYTSGDNLSSIAWVIDRVPQSHRDDYESRYLNNVSELYTRIAELLMLVKEEDWELDLKFRKTFCGFYIGNTRVFGVNLFSSPRFAVSQLTRAEVEQWSSQCEFEIYRENEKQAIYPRGTSTDSLRPIFEFAYRKVHGRL